MSNEDLTRRNMLLGGAGAAVASTIGFVRPAHAAADPSKIITLIATLQINEGKRDDALKFLEALTKAVEENEPGTLAYAAHTFKSDPHKVIFFEIYDGPEGQKNHKPGSYKTGISAAGLFAGGPKIDLLDRVAGYIR